MRGGSAELGRRFHNGDAQAHSQGFANEYNVSKRILGHVALGLASSASAQWQAARVFMNLSCHAVTWSTQTATHAVGATELAVPEAIPYVPDPISTHGDHRKNLACKRRSRSTSSCSFVGRKPQHVCSPLRTQTACGRC